MPGPSGSSGGRCTRDPQPLRKAAENNKKPTTSQAPARKQQRNQPTKLTKQVSSTTGGGKAPQEQSPNPIQQKKRKNQRLPRRGYHISKSPGGTGGMAPRQLQRQLLAAQAIRRSAPASGGDKKPYRRHPIKIGMPKRSRKAQEESDDAMMNDLP